MKTSIHKLPRKWTLDTYRGNILIFIQVDSLEYICFWHPQLISEVQELANILHLKTLKRDVKKMKGKRLNKRQVNTDHNNGNRRGCNQLFGLL